MSSRAAQSRSAARLQENWGGQERGEWVPPPPGPPKPPQPGSHHVDEGSDEDEEDSEDADAGAASAGLDDAL